MTRRGKLRSIEPARVPGLLADEERLRVFAAVALGAASVDEVAQVSRVDRAAVPRALERLAGAGLVERGDEGLRVSLETLRAAGRVRAPRRRELQGATPEQARLLRGFVDEGRIVEIPARASRRRVLLEYLAGRFDPGVEYEEVDVNQTLRLLHDDYVSLRRHLVDEGLLERQGGVYRRVA